MPNRKSVKDKVKGAAQFFQQEEDNNLSDMGTQPGTDTVEVAVTATKPDPQPQTEPEPKPSLGASSTTQPGTDTDTDTLTGTDTVLQQMLKPSENYVRKVYYPLDYQAKFITKQAKKYKRTESEILRMAIEYFIKNGKI